MVKRFVLFTRLVAACDTPDEKNVHGRRAAKLKSGWGIPSDGIWARLPKNTVKTIAGRSG